MASTEDILNDVYDPTEQALRTLLEPQDETTFTASIVACQSGGGAVNPTYGAGAVRTGTYTISGGWVDWWFRIVFGTGSTFGSGFWQLDLPFDLVADPRQSASSGFLLDPNSTPVGFSPVNVAPVTDPGLVGAIDCNPNLPLLFVVGDPNIGLGDASAVVAGDSPFSSNPQPFTWSDGAIINVSARSRLA